MVCRSNSVAPCGTNRSPFWWMIFRVGCAVCAARCRATPTWQRQSTTCLSAGPPSAGSSTMEDLSDEQCRRTSPPWVALGRKAWMFAGSDRGGERAAVDVFAHRHRQIERRRSRAWLADVLTRINDHPASRLAELLPWNWRTPVSKAACLIRRSGGHHPRCPATIKMDVSGNQDG